MHFYELQTAGATSITNVEVFFSRGSHFLLQVPVHLTSLLDLCVKPKFDNVFFIPRLSQKSELLSRRLKIVLE